MKKNALFALLALVALGSANVSCQSTRGGDGRSTGISASETGGLDRQSIYEMQDRTFRQLAY